MMNETRRDDWDPRDPSVLDDQRAAYDRMRERCPVAHSEFMGWSLFRHADVTRVLADPETFSSRARHVAIPNGMDPPEHARHREALAPIFDDASIGTLESRCRTVADELLDGLVGRDEVELVEEFAWPLALRTLCHFLGWPEELWECLGGWTHGNQQAAFSRDPAAGKALAILLAEHVRANLEQHREAGHGGDDVTDRLLALRVDGEALSDEQIVAALRNWIAGEGTVAGGLANAVLHLARDPELQQRLREDPGLLPGAVEELLRVDDPLVANRRTTTREVRVGERTIPAGEPVTLMWTAANRDPEAFDRPEQVDLERNREASLVWGQGIHLCLGAPLARLELRVGLEQLLADTSRIELAGEARRGVYPSDGMAELPVRLVGA
jgi:cytochrome P450